MIQYTIELGRDLEAIAWRGFIGSIVAPETDPQQVEINEGRSSIDENDLESDFGYAVVLVTRYRFKGVSYEAGDRNLTLLATFRKGEEATIALSERSTVANAYAFAQFIRFDSLETPIIKATDREAAIMDGMARNFVHTNGELSRVIQHSPNGLETNSFAMLNSLGNLLYHGIAEDAFYHQFLQLAGGELTAESLVGALVNLVHEPFANAVQIYELAKSKDQIFQPSLSELKLHETVRRDRQALPPPNNWTLTVKVHDSGAPNFLIGGPANFAFDKYDRLWIPNNATQGTPNSSTYCIVLNPDGSPADISPIFGGGILGCGFGVTADATGDNIWFGNFGWGPIQYNPQFGSVSQFTAEGKAVSGPNGFSNRLSRVQGLAFDPNGNLWMCSWGTQIPLGIPTDDTFEFESQNSAIVVYPGGDPSKAVSYEFETPSPDHCTFDVAFDTDGYAYVSNAGSKDVSSSVYKVKYADGEIQYVTSYESGHRTETVHNEVFRQIQVTEHEVLVGAVASNRILRFNHDLEHCGHFSNHINRPWGVGLDSAGTIYAGNFGRELPDEASGGSPDREEFQTGVTVIRGHDDSTAQLMTLPTGGEQVMLANGFPLYGTDNIPCFSPLMRMTATAVDRVGNLWAANNWKPSFGIDLTQNPPGDGVVVFVGVAAPTPPH